MISDSKSNMNFLVLATFLFMTGVMESRPLVIILAAELKVNTFNIGILISLYPLLLMFLALKIGNVIKRYGAVFLLKVNTMIVSFALFLPFSII